MTVDQAFPARTWSEGRALWRIHRSDRGVWWFSCDGTGRFDLDGSEGRGTCYLTAEPLGAFVEVFRTRIELDSDDLDKLCMTEVALPCDLRLADLCARRALRYGITAQLAADGDYGPAREFAQAAAGAGFDGVRWWVRHDPSQKLAGVALFGPAGDPATGSWPVGTARSLDARLLDSARRRFGYRLIPPP